MDCGTNVGHPWLSCSRRTFINATFYVLGAVTLFYSYLAA